MNVEEKKAERLIYSEICRNYGVKAREIAKQTGLDKTLINRMLYASPYMKDLCYRDEDFNWHGLISQNRPHRGLEDFSGYYGTVKEFLELSEEEWFEMLCKGCRQIGRNLNDTRGLFHSFRDARQVMYNLFQDLTDVAYQNWEIVFELRIKRSRMIRIYADVLIITEDKVFTLEFKMKDQYEEEEIAQAVKYVSYLEVIFGKQYDVIAALVLTKAQDQYGYVPIAGTSAELIVCSGDMLFNLIDEYLEFLEH